MRVWIEKGRYQQYRTITDPQSWLTEPYETWLEYQVYNVDGTPSTGSYRGEAHISGNTIIIGDPRYQANLTELRIADEPTEASKDHFEGFLRALDEKRRPSSKGLAKYENKSTDWWDGYRYGWKQKDERKRAKNPSNKVSIRDGRLLVAQELIDYGDPDRATYDVFVEYQVLDRDRSPMSFSYQGPADFTSDEYADERKMRIGDEVYTIVRTEEAREKWRGFYTALNDFPQERPTRGESASWVLGYREAQGQMKAHRRREKNPHEIAADFVSRHADDTTWRQRIPGGTMRPPCEFERAALAAGLAVELEHTTDPAIALEIAMDHLDEDPRYYAKHSKNPARRRSPNPAPSGSRTERIFRRVRGV